MGGGAWTTTTATNFITSKYADFGVRSFSDLEKLSTTQIYDVCGLDPALNPKGVIRECRDSEEHPNTFPIILALDVTGSMGLATKRCASKLNDIMTELYGKVKDIEFMMMGIGDLAYDRAPIQVTQFESDVRILDQTTKIWFERGGGGNSFESYTAAWYFGLNHTELDCWKRGKKGLIITMGDEPLNPYLPGEELHHTLDGQGNANLQNVGTDELYKKALERFDIFHIAITDQESSYERYSRMIRDSWGKLLGQRCLYAKSDELPKVIRQIVDECVQSESPVVTTENDGGISW